jgi:hypothetical protein
MENECPHCKFISETFKNAENSTDREYWLMTEVFVYLHGSDVCSMAQVKNEVLKTKHNESNINQTAVCVTDRKRN